MTEEQDQKLQSIFERNRTFELSETAKNTFA